MPPIRWGIIGCGDVTETKSGPAFQRVPGSELHAVMRRTGSLAADYARRHGVPRWYDDAEALVRADDIDAVYIATHPDTHCEYTLLAAASGKAVYVEKPMAVDAAQCRQMITACERAGVPLWVAYYRRALPRFNEVRRLVASGAIGDVRTVHTQRFQRIDPDAWQLRPGLSGGGYFFDAACHTLDFLDQLFGPVVEVHGLASRHDASAAHEDTVTATYRFTSGAIGSGTWCFDADTDVDSTVIVGSAGTLSFSVSRPEPMPLVRGSEVRRLAIADPPHVHQPLVQTIVDEIRGVGRSPSTGPSALRTAKTMEAILADVQTVAASNPQDQ